jgi:predicted nucleic acid-binding protein
MKVVDASALVAVLLEEPEADQVRLAIDGERLVAPQLLPFEVTNACLTKTKLFPEKGTEFADAIVAIYSLPIEYRDVDIIGTFALARRYDLTAYDASYLWLARELDLDLVTLDQDLLDALHSA